MDRTVAGERDDLGEFAGRRRAQAVRRDADRLAGLTRDEPAAVFKQPGEGIDAHDEPPLFRLRWRTAEARVRVEDRQQRQSDSCVARGRDDPRRHFGAVGVRRAVRGVMEIVKLRHAGKARLQHLDIGLGGDRLDIVRRHREREAVHGLAPGPERVGRGPADFGEPRHGALKGVAMQVRNRGDCNRMPLVALARRHIAVDRGDRSALDRQTDPRRPAFGKKRAFGKYDWQGRSPVRGDFLRSDRLCIAINWGPRKRPQWVSRRMSATSRRSG